MLLLLLQVNSNITQHQPGHAVTRIWSPRVSSYNTHCVISTQTRDTHIILYQLPLYPCITSPTPLLAFPHVQTTLIFFHIGNAGQSALVNNPLQSPTTDKLWDTCLSLSTWYSS